MRAAGVVATADGWRRPAVVAYVGGSGAPICLLRMLNKVESKLELQPSSLLSQVVLFPIPRDIPGSAAGTLLSHHGLVTETPALVAVRDEAERFRKAIQAAVAQDSLGEVLTAFRKFPAGSCGKATAMLCVHLRNTGLGNWAYVMGTQGREAGYRTHAWAALHGVVLDITGSQFPGRPDIWLGEPDAWFAEWESGPPRRACWDEGPSTDEGWGFQLVLKYL